MRKLYLLLLLAAGCLPHAKPDASPLTVLVYNIHAGKDAKGVDNLERVSQIIRDTKADIVLLQEVDKNTTRSGRVDQVAKFEQLTGFHGAFGKTLDYQGDDYGIAILSRWPIAFDTLVHLPVNPPQLRSGVSYEPRGALVALVNSPVGRLRIVNTHLDASGSDSFRIQEAPTVLQAADPDRLVVASAPDLGRVTTLIGGDFNSEPNSSVHAMVVAAGWHDTFAECGKGEGLSWPDDKPRKRIDYLWFKGPTRCVDAAVLDTNASDHRPVLFHMMIPH
jgi:endonuclease/exonuclease/phosphatase family metal-dependent hydrolase